MNNPSVNLTNRQLRQLLTALENQDQTVRELRNQLFDLVAQDEQFDPALVNQTGRSASPEQVR